MRELEYGVEVELTGITKLLMHAYNANKTMDGRNPDEWKEEVYLSSNSSKHLVYPHWVIDAFMRNAAKGQKLAKSALNKILARGVVLTDLEVPVLVDGKQVTIKDIEANKWLWTTTVQIGKAKVQKTRVHLPQGWSIKFRFNVIEKVLLADSLKRFFEVAGYQEGLGQWRPGSPKPGKFGQFICTRFNVQPSGYEEFYEKEAKSVKLTATV
jgi:hypothetical protein